MTPTSGTIDLRLVDRGHSVREVSQACRDVSVVGTFDTSPFTRVFSSGAVRNGPRACTTAMSVVSPLLTPDSQPKVLCAASAASRGDVLLMSSGDGFSSEEVTCVLTTRSTSIAESVEGGGGGREE